MEEIIAPVPIEKIENELTNEHFVRYTNYGGNMIYVVNCHNAPNVVKEIGRLREITFRNAGGGTGKEIDLDDYDLSDNPYQQLIVWNPREKEITGGYRFFLCKNATISGNKVHNLSTADYFEFSEKFISDYLPYTIELGRSFIPPAYQASQGGGKKGLFALDNLWDGLGSLIIMHPEVKYFFGKVTMYKHFDEVARDYLLVFLNKYFSDKENLIHPLHPVEVNFESHEYNKLFTGKDFKKDVRILIKKVRSRKENIPPLINAYMNLSPTMKVFGTAFNKHFGNVEETAIMIKIEDIYEIKKDRHILYLNDMNPHQMPQTRHSLLKKAYYSLDRYRK